MRSPSARATSTVEWAIQPVSVGGLTFAVAPPGGEPVPRRRLDGSAEPDAIGLVGHRGTGVGHSVSRPAKGLRWRSLPGVRTSWSGQRCDLGHIDVWLPTDQPPHRRGPLSLLAKFPQSDPPGDDVSVLLGLDFFLTRQAEFQLLLPPQDGRILLP